MSAPPTVTPDPPRRRRGRPSRFSPADAVAAALDIGVSTFTMSAVAQRLEVTTPALYRCFPSREALLEASLSAVFARSSPMSPCRRTTPTGGCSSNGSRREAGDC
ncbi:MAG TPA: hypothetical protein DIW82_06730 [Corynebacterium nuruki]|uniref:HTH tetR-type domain-containing protein n=1 Tax=Corynebacterium nuruki TaxID=1032851 RepID=A0A3D4T151_9CORY|nr:hypothetical protein [Corynebacterium nuruki]